MPELKLENICKNFGKKTALRDVTCEFSNGITALLGPNGAGKSTMMNVICTLLKADSGTISFNGRNVTEQKISYLKKLSIQFQNQPMYRTDTAIEYLLFCGALKGIPEQEIKQQGQELMKRFGIADTGKKRISAFSGGMRQRLALCGTFLGYPEIIMLDEPSAGLDIYEREELKHYLSELKKDRIIIISTHIVSDIENIADNILLLNEGSIHSSGTQQELVQTLEGRIWQIPADANYQGPCYYSDGKQLTACVQLPCPGALPKKADLTDVYFSCVKTRYVP